MTQEQVIADAIRAWLEASSRRNKSLLSRLSGTSYSSVRRAASGEAEQNSTVVVPIAKLVMTPQNFHAFVAKYYPNQSDSIIMIMRNDAPDEIGEFLDSPDHLRIIILADSKTGTNEDEVERKFGESSLAYFEDLKDSDVLRHRNGSWYFDGNLHASSMPQTRKIFSTIMMSCDRRNDKIPNASYSGFGWESVNHETLEKLYEMEERHDKERFALVSKPESKGNILAVYGSFLNVLKGLLEKTK